MKLAREYLQSPTGEPAEDKRLRLDTPRQIQQDYPHRIKYRIGITGKNELVFYAKIPSRRKAGLFHDVVITFNGSMDENNKTPLMEQPFKAFSNCPSFYFRYARPFKNEGMLVDYLVKKLDPKVFDPPANGQERSVSYERTVYTLLFILYQDGVLSEPFYVIVHRARKITEASLLNSIQSQEDVEGLREKNRDTRQEKARKKNIAERKKAREDAKNNPYLGLRTIKTKSVGNVQRVKHSAPTNRTHKTAKVKHI